MTPKSELIKILSTVKGKHYNDETVINILSNVDMFGYYPAINDKGILTGDILNAININTLFYLTPDELAAIPGYLLTKKLKVKGIFVYGIPKKENLKLKK